MAHTNRHNPEFTQENKDLRKEIERLHKIINNLRSRSDVYELKITKEDGETVSTWRGLYCKHKDAMHDLYVYAQRFDRNSKTHYKETAVSVSPRKTVLKFTLEDGATFDGYVLRIKTN